MKKYLHYTNESWTLKDENGVEHAANLNDSEAEEAIRAEAVKVSKKQAFDFGPVLDLPEIENICAGFEAVFDEVGKSLDDMMGDLSFIDPLNI